MPAAHHPTRPTLEDLASWSWKQFERFAVEVLGAYYRRCGLELVPTPFVHDGGKDGEAIYVFGKESADEATSDLDIVIRLWVEVKQLQKGAVDLDRVSGHVVLASNRGITKLVLVTNGVFAKRVKQELREYTDPTRISLAFVEGAALLDMHGSAATTTALSAAPASRGRAARRNPPKAPALAPVICTVHYAASPHVEASVLNAAPLELEVGDPLFLVVDVEVGGGTVPTDARIEVEAAREAGEVRPLWSSFCAPLMAGEHSRAVFVCHPLAGAEVASDAVRVTVATAAGPLATAHAGGRARVKPASLAPMELTSHREAVAELRGRLDAWLRDGGITMLGLRAVGGVGKSHHARMLRRRWLSAAPYEIVLDPTASGRHDEVGEIVRQLLRAVLHVPAHAPGEEVERALAALCNQAGVHPRAAEELRVGWRRLREDNAVAFREPGEMLAALLTLASARRLVVVAVEDLHKLRPSALQLLLEMLRLLRHGARGNVLFVATTRPAAMRGSATGSAAHDTPDPLESLFELLGEGLADLPSPSRADAVALLAGSVVGLGTALAEGIVDQVGTTPFSLKEALLFLETGALRRIDGGPAPFELLDLAAFHYKVRPGKLRHATRERLAELRALLGADGARVDDFLVCGAVLGRAFPTSVALVAAGGAALSTRAEAILFRWDVLRTWRRDGQLVCEFAHDLIRAAVLDAVDADRLQQLSSVLDDTDLSDLPPLTRARVAAHAGNNARCNAIAEESARAAEADHRLWDAFQAVLIRVSTTDPDRFTRVLLEGQLANLITLDESLLRIGRDAEPAPRPVRVRAVYALLFEAINLLTRIGVGMRHGAAPLLTEVAMLAEELDDDAGRARIDYFRGRAHFSADDFAAAARYHRAAEARFRRVDPDGTDRRTNLHRLFLCERQMGRLARARAYLRRLSALNGDTPGASERARGISYRGYAELYHDLRRTLELWREAYAVADAAGLHDRAIEHRLGCGYVAVLLDEREAAAADFADVEERLRARDLESSRLRLHLDRGALHLSAGRVADARMELEEAQRIAVKYGNLRRLWRVDANLATVFEAFGDARRAEDFDLRALAGWKARAVHEERFGAHAPWLGQRHVLAPLNVAFRAREGSAAHATMLEVLPASARDEVRRLAALAAEGARNQLPGQLGFHIKEVRGRTRAVLTE